MNLTNFEATPIFRAFEMVRREAGRYGVAIAASEIVGLVPQKALDACAEYFLQLEGFSARQVLENRLTEALPPGSGIDEFVASVAAPAAVPGGGSVAALAGSLASALGQMVAGLTTGKKKFESVHQEVEAVRERLAAAGNELRKLVDQDADAYRSVVAALGLPKETEGQRAARAEAIQSATRAATETPLRTARTAALLLEPLETLISIGNPTAKSDAAVGMQLAHAAVKGAQYNVLINLPGLKDKDFARSCREEVTRLSRRSQEIVARIDGMMTEGVG
jgi:formiminotetrahydrofolate cyclodeaminase